MSFLFRPFQKWGKNLYSGLFYFFNFFFVIKTLSDVIESTLKNFEKRLVLRKTGRNFWFLV